MVEAKNSLPLAVLESRLKMVVSVSACPHLSNSSPPGYKLLLPYLGPPSLGVFVVTIPAHSSHRHQCAPPTFTDLCPAPASSAVHSDQDAPSHLPFLLPPQLLPTSLFSWSVVSLPQEDRQADLFCKLLFRIVRERPSWVVGVPHSDHGQEAAFPTLGPLLALGLGMGKEGYMFNASSIRTGLGLRRNTHESSSSSTSSCKDLRWTLLISTKQRSRVLAEKLVR